MNAAMGRKPSTPGGRSPTIRPASSPCTQRAKLTPIEATVRRKPTWTLRRRSVMRERRTRTAAPGCGTSGATRSSMASARSSAHGSAVSLRSADGDTRSLFAGAGDADARGPAADDSTAGEATGGAAADGPLIARTP